MSDVWTQIRGELNRHEGDKLYDHRWRMLFEALLELKAQKQTTSVSPYDAGHKRVGHKR